MPKQLMFIGLAVFAFIVILYILLEGVYNEPLESILSDADPIDGSANAGRRAL